MRTPLSSFLAATIVFGGPAFASSARAAPSITDAAPAKKPEELYEEGRKAYRLGDFEIAATKWEEAFALSDNALLLYNISLAYKGLHGISKDLSDLRKARAVLDNFIKLAEADPALDVDDAPERLAELDELIRTAEEAEAASRPPPPKVAPDAEKALKAVPTGPDPGKKFRLGGIVTMSTGGALLLTAAGLVGFFAIRGEDFSSKLRASLEEEDSLGCANMPEGSVSVECRQLAEDISSFRNNGRQANRGAIISGAVGGGLGLVALVAGAVVFTEGNRRTRAWEKGIADLRIVPSGRGLTISGRF